MYTSLCKMNVYIDLTHSYYLIYTAAKYCQNSPTPQGIQTHHISWIQIFCYLITRITHILLTLLPGRVKTYWHTTAPPLRRVYTRIIFRFTRKLLSWLMPKPLHLGVCVYMCICIYIYVHIYVQVHFTFLASCRAGWCQSPFI